jgi:hypothetical protein
MRVLRLIGVSIVTGLFLESACFKAPEDRDFGKLSAAGESGTSNDASSGGGGGGSGGRPSGGSGGALPGGDAQAPDAGHCTADKECDDHDKCSGTEKCVGGTCQPGTALNNKTTCTLTVLSVADAGADSGSVTTLLVPGLCFEGKCLRKCAATKDCDDGNPCTGQETCDGSRGVCVQGVAPKCDDSNDCTKDTCDPKTGACVNDLIDADGDGHADSKLGSCGDDCDDADKTVYKGAAELCDGKDNDCNLKIDDNTPFWYIDCDGDGFAPSTANAVQQCTAPTGGPPVCGGAGKWTAVAPVSPETKDCDDAVPEAYPGNEEVCDGVDNDCSGTADDVLPKKWADCDNDGAARSGAPAIYACVYNQGAPPACPMGSWTTTEPVPGSIDCSDNNSAISPYAGEDCANPDNVDNNCDGVVDGYLWFKDCDSDGYAAAGATSSSVGSCATPSGATGCANGGGQWVTTYPIGQVADCDDTNSLVYPYAYYQTAQDQRWAFDYNCDKETSKQYTATDVSPSAPCTLGGFLFPICVGVDGYTGSTVPECGQTAEMSLCNCANTSGGFYCDTCQRVVSTTTAQGCR